MDSDDGEGLWRNVGRGRSNRHYKRNNEGIYDSEVGDLKGSTGDLLEDFWLKDIGTLSGTPHFQDG